MRSFQGALAADVRKEVSRSFLRGLRSRVDAESCKLLPSLEDLRSPRDVGGKETPLEQEVLRNCHYQIRSGRRGPDILREALRMALDARADAQVREIATHILTEDSLNDSVRGTLRAIEEARNLTSIGHLADQILTGQATAGLFKQAPAGMDEDLRSSGQNQEEDRGNVGVMDVGGARSV